MFSYETAFYSNVTKNKFVRTGERGEQQLIWSVVIIEESWAHTGYH